MLSSFICEPIRNDLWDHYTKYARPVTETHFVHLFKTIDMVKVSASNLNILPGYMIYIQATIVLEPSRMHVISAFVSAK